MDIARLLHLGSRNRDVETAGRPAQGRRLSLALQGGGALGAFTWGVLDRLLDEDITFDTISGASSGAISAMLLVSGLQQGGPAEARARLERFWRRATGTAAEAFARSSLRSGLALFPRALSPYQLNPLGFNPLREVLQGLVDFDAIAQADIALLVATTRVRDGALRIFRNGDMSLDAVLASAALPMIHHAIRIDEDWYWDGGYVSNPPLIPLALEAGSPNVLVVQVVPTSGQELPKTTREINGRLTQMAFNRSLAMEIDMIAQLTGARDAAVPDGDVLHKLHRLQLGHIRAEDTFDDLTRVSQLDLNWPTVMRLHAGGHAAAERWLAAETASATQPS